MPAIRTAISLWDGNDTADIQGRRTFDAVDGEIELKERQVVLFSDTFNNSSLDPKWTPAVANGGTVVENNVNITFDSSVNPAKASLIYFNDVQVSASSSRVYKMRSKYLAPEQSGNNIFSVRNGTTATPVASAPTDLVLFIQYASGALWISYYDDINVRRDWRGSAWSTSLGNTGSTLTIDTYYTFFLEIAENAGTWQWRVVVKTADELSTIQTTSWVNWSDTASRAAMWATMGEIWNNGAVGLTACEYFEISGLAYSASASPANDWTSFAVDDEIGFSNFYCQERMDSGDAGSNKYDYHGNGALISAGLTQAQVRGLLPLTITDAVNSVKFVPVLEGDTTQRSSCQTVAFVNVTPATTVCDYPADTDVRDGVVYDSGAETGTAAIPGASDVRTGVAVDATVGTAAIPGPDDVRDGVPVDATTGNYEPADPDKYFNGEQYGSDGTEFTGTLVPVTVEGPIEVIAIDDEPVVIVVAG